MNYFSRMNPLRAIKDLRLFLHQRQPHELGFLALAVVLTGLLIGGFAKDSRVEKVYRPEIVYVKQWTLDRTDAEIRAQQAIDAPKERAAREQLKQQQEKTKAEFKRLDDKLNSWGL